MISSCNPSHKYNNRHFTAIESRSPWYLTYNTPLSSLNLGPPRAFTRVQCDICVKRLPGYHATSALTITFLCITHSQNIKYAIKHRFQGWPRGNARVGGKTIRIHKQTIWKYYVVDVSKWWRNYEGKFIYAIYPRFHHGPSWLWGYDWLNGMVPCTPASCSSVPKKMAMRKRKEVRQKLLYYHN